MWVRFKGVYFHSLPVPSVAVFRNCLRIGEVMSRTMQARDILHRHGIKQPLWMWGLPGSLKSSPAYSRDLMTFLLSMGFYDRFVHRKGGPTVVMGSSAAVPVAAYVKSFESRVLALVAGDMDFDSSCFRVYGKVKAEAKRFSLISSVGASSEDFKPYFKKSFLLPPLGCLFKKSPVSHRRPVKENTYRELACFRDYRAEDPVLKEIRWSS